MSRVEILNLVFGNFLVYSTVPNKRGPNSRWMGGKNLEKLMSGAGV